MYNCNLALISVDIRNIGLGKGVSLNIAQVKGNEEEDGLRGKKSSLSSGEYSKPNII